MQNDPIKNTDLSEPSPGLATDRQPQSEQQPAAPVVPQVFAPQSQPQPGIVFGSGLTPPAAPAPPKKLGRSAAYILYGIVFLLCALIGFFGYKLATATPKTTGEYSSYQGDGPFRFDYPKGWIMKEKNGLSKTPLSYYVTMQTSDFTAQEDESDITEITTKGYRFSVFYRQSEGIFKNVDEAYEHYKDEKTPGLKKIRHPSGAIMIQTVGQPSAIPSLSHNSRTDTGFSRDGYDFLLTYEYPDRDDDKTDPRYLQQYEHFIKTFSEQ